MHDIILPLIDPASCAVRTVEAGRVIIAPGEPTSLLFLLRAGEARSSDGSHAVAGDMLSLCEACLLYTSPSPRDPSISRMPSSA